MRRIIKEAAFLFLLAMAGMIGIVGSASAGISVYETATSSFTTIPIVLSTAALQVDAAPRNMNVYSDRRMSLEIFNNDSSANVFCGYTLAVSSIAPTVTVPNPGFGRRIPAGSSWSISLSYQMPVYCVSDTNNSVIVLTQLGGG